MFSVVQQTGSFKEAALRLGVTVSAVSQSIQTLEMALGQDLFDRTARPVALTPFGLKFAPVACKLVEAARTYQLACDDLLQSRQREIRIGCVDSFAATVGPALVKSMTSQNGNVVMLSGITPQMLTHLARHEIDMAICTAIPANQADLHVIALFEESWVVVSPLEFDWPERLSFKQLRELSTTLPLVRYTQRSNIGSQIDQFLIHIGIDAPRRFEFDATDSLLSLVSSGAGWALTSPLCLLQSEHHAKRVRISLLPAGAHGARRFYALSAKEAIATSASDVAQGIRTILATQTLTQLQAIHPALNARLLKTLN